MSKQHYSSELSQDELIILSRLLNKPLYQIYCHTVTVHHDSVEARGFSFKLDDGWLNLTSEWKETPNYINYYKLSLQESQKPFSIEYEVTDKAKIITASSIMIDRGRKPYVRSIEVYTTKEEWDDEIIEYDSHIVLHLDRGVNVCLAAIDTVAEMIELSTSSECIHKMLSDASKRLSLPH